MQADCRERPCLIDVAERSQAIHDVGTTTEGPDGEPTADDLAEAGEVRTNTIELLRTTTGSTEAADDFVEDKQYALFLRHTT